MYVSADGTNHLRMIRVGEQLPGGYTAILGGLQPGEMVLRDPSLGSVQSWNGAPAPKGPDR